MLTEFEAHKKLKMSKESFDRLRNLFCILPDDYDGHTPLYYAKKVKQLAEYRKVCAELGRSSRSWRATETQKIQRRNKKHAWAIK
jgi:hypothetical protein